MYPTTLSLTQTLPQAGLNFVDPTRPNNVQQIFFFLLFTSEGFEDRENVMDGISFGNYTSYEIRKVAGCKAPFTLNCSSDESIRRT